MMRIRRITRLLHKEYGKPPALKMSDPVDELVRTVLSQNTSDKNSLGAFGVLKKHFKSWEALLKTNTPRIARLIRHAGLSNIKARRIKEALKEIKVREGRIGLSLLRNLSINDSLGYLRSLRGVGPKTAACVLLFSFGKPVMPVDTHIFRVTKRLGIIGARGKGQGARVKNIGQAHEFLTRVVPKDLIYDFHLGIIEHGRKTCKAQNPRCSYCALYGLCRFKDKRFYRKRGRG